MTSSEFGWRTDEDADLDWGYDDWGEEHEYDSWGWGWEEWYPEDDDEEDE